jgi:hypothetical protein
MYFEMLIFQIVVFNSNKFRIPLIQIGALLIFTTISTSIAYRSEN